MTAAADHIATRSIVIGTAGHVDHGKSTLVQALTGIDPDRLAEEKAREMTIDLGFAWLTLPSGRTASIVDVPGHERFIKNMLAGVGGIDIAMLVIAADEGPMPQTTEHLAILDLLGIEHGLIAVTKTDLVDADWLDLVQSEIQEHIAASSLRHAPLIPVSARTGAGLDQLTRALDDLYDRLPPRTGGDRPRLPVDRVFTMSGFGTVATGTLTGGDLTLGQELRLYPGDQIVRVRGLQTHRRRVERATPGNRVAVNLAGVAVEEIRRGDVLAPPSLLTPSTRVDVQLHLLPGVAWQLEQNSEVDFFTGAAELPARVTLLDRDVLRPGEDGWVQLRLRQPVAVLHSDRFIVRRPSPSETIGGGRVIDPAPPKHRRFRPEVLQSLATLATGSPAELVLTAVAQRPRTIRSLRAEPPAGLNADQADEALKELIRTRELAILGAGPAELGPDRFVTAVDRWDQLRNQLRSELAAFHAGHPLRRGMPHDALKARLGLEGRLLDEVIATAAVHGDLADEGQTIRLPDFRIELTAADRQTVDRFLAAIAAQPFSPPSPATFGLDDELVLALDHLGEIVRVDAEIVFAADTFAQITAETLASIDQAGSISLAGFRDQFQTSRKYAQAVLEYLDRRRITRRVGDERIRGPAADAPPPSGAIAAGHNR